MDCCCCKKNALLLLSLLCALQPMKHWYKPLAFYVTMEAAALLCRVALQAAGFQRHEWMGLAYYTRNMSAQQIRPSTDLPAGFYRSSSGMHVHQPGRAASLGQHRSRSSEQVPLVLLHGVGMGLVPYISVLFNMAATGEEATANPAGFGQQCYTLSCQRCCCYLVTRCGLNFGGCFGTVHITAAVPVSNCLPQCKAMLAERTLCMRRSDQSNVGNKPGLGPTLAAGVYPYYPPPPIVQPLLQPLLHKE